MFRAIRLQLLVRLLLLALPVLSLGATAPRSNFVVANGVRLHYLD